MVDRKHGEMDGLHQELRELHGQIAALEAAVKKKPDYSLGEGDPAITQWELDQAMLAELRSRVEGLERQLCRISEGTYGICEGCGEPIDPGRLAVLPDTNICIECARSGEW
jgi:RNA polymerase-binding transcription factor DksA